MRRLGRGRAPEQEVVPVLGADGTEAAEVGGAESEGVGSPVAGGVGVVGAEGLGGVCCISLYFDKILQIIPMEGRGIFWINSLLQERVTVASLTETYGSTGPLPGLNSLLQQ